MSSSSAWAMQLKPCLILKNTHKQESVLSVRKCVLGICFIGEEVRLKRTVWN